MVNFSLMRFARAYKVLLHNYFLNHIELSSEIVKNIPEKVKNILKKMKNILRNMKNSLRILKFFIFVVNKSIKYLLFSFYSTKELMVNADMTMIAAR